MYGLIYIFSKNFTEGSGEMKRILGGKGAGLAEMCKLGLPVPPGFTISSELCRNYYKNDMKLDESFWSELYISLNKLEELSGKKFGCKNNPLLLSVRSGSEVSMPGMMDTILNLGLNNLTVEALASSSGDYRFAFDSYRRFIQMYSDVVLGVSHYHFENILDEYKLNLGITNDADFSSEDLKNICTLYKQKVFALKSITFPEDIESQLKMAIIAVLDSWMNPRAVKYRQIYSIDDSCGTAVNIQSMVFGNLNNNSATGVAFTRNPSTGEKGIYGEFLVNAQGEDVVAGIRTPVMINKVDGSMEFEFPDVYNDFVSICNKLEDYYLDMQDVEFTVEDGQLFILQTRNGKRTAAAAIKIAYDLVKEGKISKEEALIRLDAESISKLLHPRIDNSKNLSVIATGLPASPGAASGIVVFSAEEAEELSLKQKVILVRNDTTPEDIKGMHVSQGVLTARGGMTSHAAVVARGMGKPCVCGVSAIKIDEANKFIKIGSTTISSGDLITIDGTTGDVILGEASVIAPEFSFEFKEILSWADSIKLMKVRANAETMLDAETSINFGAEGIGLCRTEHMFFDADQINIVRKMILALDNETRLAAISELMPLQRSSFYSLLQIMKGFPVNIRLLDPPLHEFLPHSEIDIKNSADYMSIPYDLIKEKVDSLTEKNPMLGHRGCRLGITYPEIYEMQVRAIFSAAIDLYNSESIVSNIEVMIPLISTDKEFSVIKSRIDDIMQEMLSSFDIKVKIGTMIELPRAALIADSIAREAEFFSFGTNDLTQTTYGISRDDISSFLPSYQRAKIFVNDPFVEIDELGVGALIKIAKDLGRSVRPDLSLGICGEHGGNPKSINFCHNLGLDYVSCSPYRIPVAKIAAAQAVIRNKRS